jgi:hypothetical protein
MNQSAGSRCRNGELVSGKDEDTTSETPIDNRAILGPAAAWMQDHTTTSFVAVPDPGIE